jgi:hypothetical protein
MTYMMSRKNHRLTSHTWLGLTPQIGRPLSRIGGAIGFFRYEEITLKLFFYKLCKVIENNV